MHRSHYQNDYYFKNTFHPHTYHSTEDYQYFYSGDIMDENFSMENLPKKHKKISSNVIRRRRSSLNSHHNRLYKETLSDSRIYDEQFENNYNYQQEQHIHRRLGGVRSVSPYINYEDDTIFQKRAMLDPNQSWVHQPNNKFSNFMPQQPMTNAPKSNYYGIQQNINDLGVGVTSKAMFPPMTTNAFIPSFNHLNNYNNELRLMPQPVVPMIQVPNFVYDNTNFMYHPLYQLYNNLSVASANVINAFGPNMFTQNADVCNILNRNQDDGNTENNGKTEFINDEPHELKSASQELSHSTSSKSNTETTIATDEKMLSNTVANNLPAGQRKIVIRRRKSLMEGILSSFSLLQEPETYAVVSESTNSAQDPQCVSEKEASTVKEITNSNQIGNHLDLTTQSTAITGNDSQISTNTFNQKDTESEATYKSRSSLRLSQKANFLKSREYIWCYRPKIEKNEVSDKNKAYGSIEYDNKRIWTAFDLTNQNILDYHYSSILAKKNNPFNIQQNNTHINTEIQVTTSKTDNSSSLLMLDKQGNLPSSVMVSIQDGIAWYKSGFDSDLGSNTLGDNANNNERLNVLEIAYMPTRFNTLVLNENNEEEIKDNLSPTKFNSSLRRSKSIDKMANNLFRIISRW